MMRAIVGQRGDADSVIMSQGYDAGCEEAGARRTRPSCRARPSSDPSMRRLANQDLFAPGSPALPLPGRLLRFLGRTDGTDTKSAKGNRAEKVLTESP